MKELLNKEYRIYFIYMLATAFLVSVIIYSTVENLIIMVSEKSSGEEASTLLLLEVAAIVFLNQYVDLLKKQEEKIEQLESEIKESEKTSSYSETCQAQQAVHMNKDEGRSAKMKQLLKKRCGKYYKVCRVILFIVLFVSTVFFLKSCFESSYEFMSTKSFESLLTLLFTTAGLMLSFESFTCFFGMKIGKEKEGGKQ